MFTLGSPRLLRSSLWGCALLDPPLGQGHLVQAVERAW